MDVSISVTVPVNCNSGLRTRALNPYPFPNSFGSTLPLLLLVEEIISVASCFLNIDANIGGVDLPVNFMTILITPPNTAPGNKNDAVKNCEINLLIGLTGLADGT